jgi:hypothetical protein
MIITLYTYINPPQEMKKRTNSKKDADKVTVEDVEDDTSEEDERDTKKKTTMKPKKPEGYNWAAIVIMLLFLVPSAIALVMQVVDYAYPAQAKARMIRDRVVRFVTI